MVLVIVKEGSPFIEIVHLAGKFGGDPFSPAKYQDQVIDFVVYCVQGVNPVAIFVEDDAWQEQGARLR